MPTDADLTTDDFISLLMDGEGDSITFCSQNADYNFLPNELVIVNASWTAWADVSFRGHTRRECLQMALAKMREAA
jgi:hypothetical protein